MSTPPIPPQAEPFIRYLPTIAEYIRTNRRPSRGELALVRMFAPEAWRTLKTLTYEQIVAYTAPYEAHPEYGVYVRLVKSDRGREWITDVLRDVKGL